MDPESPFRRSLLRVASGVSAMSLLAGCSTPSGETGDRHEVTVVNSLSADRTYRVTITGDDDNQLADEVLELGPERVEDFVFRGTAERVEVRVDGRLVREFRWQPSTNDTYSSLHPDGCSARTTTSLTIGLIDDTLHVQYGCETVRRESS